MVELLRFELKRRIRWVLTFSSCTLILTTALENVSAAQIKLPPPKVTSAVENESSDTQRDRPAARRTIDEQVERGVLRMVQNHLPDIKVLLDQLRINEPQQYDSAIRNLAKSSRRLETAKKRGEELFELEVHIVQAQSSINLLIAKLKIRDNKRDRQALMEATKRFQQAEIARAQYEVTQLKSRLERMTTQLQNAEKRLNEKQVQFDDNVESGFKTYLRKSGRKD